MMQGDIAFGWLNYKIVREFLVSKLCHLYLDGFDFVSFLFFVWDVGFCVLWCKFIYEELFELGLIKQVTIYVIYCMIAEVCAKIRFGRW